MNNPSSKTSNDITQNNNLKINPPFFYPFTIPLKLRLTRQNITKFIVATAAFYALLTSNVFRIGEIISPVEKDYINATTQADTRIITTGDIYIQDATQETNTHGAAPITGLDKKKFDAVCTSNKLLCKSISFESTYTDSEKYIYLSSIFRIVNFVDDYLVTQQKAENALQRVAVNKDS